MNEYAMLNEGVGSPGETTRVMSREYLKLRSPFKTKATVIREIIEKRAEIYRNIIGVDILNRSLIEKAIRLSDNELPFLIFVDIIVTMNQQGSLFAVNENLDILTEVIVDNYNSLLPNKAVLNTFSLKERVKIFINQQF